MEIQYDSALADYMTSKGIPHLIVDVCTAKTCGGAIAELDIQAVDSSRADEARSHAQAIYQGELGAVLIMAREIAVDECVTFRLRRFFGVKDIVAEGIRTYQ